MKVKSINSLMKYLRTQKHIDISGGAQKKKLRNIGYYHGYKGYRFFAKPNNSLQYTNFDELIAVYDFDMQIKSIIYPQIMFLETAFKNYALEEVIEKAQSDRFADIYTKLLLNHKLFSVGSDKYKKALSKRLTLRNRIYGDLARDYNNKLIVQHYYQKDKPVPIWAVFELISFGEFGTFFNCLDKSIKVNISRSIGFNIAYDSEGKLTETIVYTLKDLRNAIAHNDTIFDTRFKTGDISNILSNYICRITNIKSISFDTIVDYIVLISYLMKCFGMNKIDIKKFIRDFTNSYETLKTKIPVNIFAKIIHTDTRKKLEEMCNYL